MAAGCSVLLDARLPAQSEAINWIKISPASVHLV